MMSGFHEFQVLQYLGCISDTKAEAGGVLKETLKRGLYLTSSDILYCQEFMENPTWLIGETHPRDDSLFTNYLMYHLPSHKYHENIDPAISIHLNLNTSHTVPHRHGAR